MPSPETLNDDIRLLGRTLGDVIADQAGSDTLDLVESIRRAAVGDADPARLIDLLDPLQIGDALHVIRAFSYFAMLANIAEDIDHARRRRALVQSGAAAPAGTLAHAIESIAQAGVDADDVQRAVATSEVIAVLTAHPTEIRRKTIQSIQTSVAALMEQRDRVAMSQVEEGEWRDELWRQIVTLWQTAMLRLTKLRLRDEVNDAMRYFELSLLSQVPQLNAAVNAAFGVRPDRERPLLRIGSWIGGDRDGNPFVTSEVLADTFQQQATLVLGHHLSQLWCLAEELSMSSRLITPDPAVLYLTEAAGDTSPYRLDEPYRRALRGMHARLAATARHLVGTVPGNSPIGERQRYGTPAELLADLDVIDAAFARPRRRRRRQRPARGASRSGGDVRIPFGDRRSAAELGNTSAGGRRVAADRWGL